MKQIYILLVIINALTAIWCAAMGDFVFMILMTIFAFLNANFYFEEREQK